MSQASGDMGTPGGASTLTLPEKRIGGAIVEVAVPPGYAVAISSPRAKRASMKAHVVPEEGPPNPLCGRGAAKWNMYHTEEAWCECLTLPRPAPCHSCYQNRRIIAQGGARK